MVVKSSRDETFVYAQNMRSGKPWDGVQVLLSNGAEIFAEGKTGGDGVFRQASKKLHFAERRPRLRRRRRQHGIERRGASRRRRRARSQERGYVYQPIARVSAGHRSTFAALIATWPTISPSFRSRRSIGSMYSMPVIG